MENDPPPNAAQTKKKNLRGFLELNPEFLKIILSAVDGCLVLFSTGHSLAFQAVIVHADSGGLSLGVVKFLLEGALLLFGKGQCLEGTKYKFLLTITLRFCRSTCGVFGQGQLTPALVNLEI